MVESRQNNQQKGKGTSHFFLFTFKKISTVTLQHL